MAFFFVTLSLFLSIAVAWYRLTPGIIWICVGGALAVAAAAFRFRRPKEEKHAVIESPPWTLFVPVSMALMIGAAVLLFRSESSAPLTTPWGTIHPWFVPIFFLITLFLALFVTTSNKTKVVLFLLVLYSFLQHGYLSLSHELPWGGDVWRHIAVEEELLHGQPELPVLFGPDATVEFIPQKYSYAQLWGVTVFVAKITGTDLLMVNKWLVPILWSIATPLLLFRLGTLLFQSRRYGLFLAALSALPFPFHALGALTLPVSMGYITFFYALTLWTEYVVYSDTVKRNMSVFLAVLMVFSYPLHFLLIWMVIIGTIIARWIENAKRPWLTHSLTIVVSVGSVLVIPVIEVVGHISQIPQKIDALVSLKSFVGQFSGWYFASVIRPHDILSGNIFFNHAPLYAFVPNFFLVWRWWIIPVMVLLWGIAVIGFIRAPKTVIWSMFRYLLVTVFGGYVIGWYILVGDRLFTRRLDAMLAFLVLIFFLQGVLYLGSRYTLTARHYTFIPAVLLSFFVTATYTSGPDIRVVSRDEYDAARYVWNSIGEEISHLCVLADTWTLLPLEALSVGRIVGGGFPIDYQFGQPEREVLLREMIANPRPSVLTVAKEKTGAAACTIILPREGEKTDQMTTLVGTAPASFGELSVWQGK